MCVVTKLNFFAGQLSQSVHPDPFRNECLNMIEWLMVSMIPFLVIGFVSLVFLLRKVCSLCEPTLACEITLYKTFSVVAIFGDQYNTWWLTSS